ncbi:MAG: CDP-diacylglycerol--serine O-phosphatidyltransferase [Candidatus Zixiibacteriota bacterium]|nr:MAG: CDP-diacylglycerol--serine O-phosphatidyltransferase [candidate division Zixibacteria bacterium]
MRNIKGILPGIFTMGNLACGFGAIVISGGASYLTGFQRDFRINEAVWLIILAAFFDILDGLVARFSKTSTRFGVEIDSLADIISFGVAPAVLIINFSLISKGNWAWILAFVYLMAASFRLARFNVTATIEEKNKFLGMPVPVAAVTIVSFILFENEVLGGINPEKFYIILVLVTSALMVSVIEFETMPGFDFSRRFNRMKVLFLFLVAVGMMINSSLILFPVVAIYIAYAILRFVIYMFYNVGKSGLYGKRIGFGRRKNKQETE